MEIFSSPFEEPCFGFTMRAFFLFYLVFMFTTSSKNCSNNKLIEQPHRYLNRKSLSLLASHLLNAAMMSAVITCILQSKVREANTKK